MNDSTRINKIDMLYRVNCISRHFEAQNLQIVDNENLETTQVLSLQFNQQANVLAAGDSNGRVQVTLFYSFYYFYHLKFFFIIMFFSSYLMYSLVMH